ncbi:Rv2175c family DNA-binding protein [Microbacterium aoyamense]|uniref:Rv2175c family DNA-binding protein n=1 Tax=Microbacterium aoyamense TaxID=344166 RepID=A0ABN2PUU3_9MICO|nr:Rv2175c family DNA-binding protein [Microbacterium aoyamense]
MTDDLARQHPTAWLSLPELADVLDEPVGRVRRLIEDLHLVGSRRHGAISVPAVFIKDGEPLTSLRGTVIVLHDAGFSDDEAIDWLLSPDDSIGMPPIDALVAGRKAEVRRVAATLA